MKCALKLEDLYVGAEVVCIYVGGYKAEFTVGNTYQITQVGRPSSYPYSSIDDCGGTFVFNMDDVNEDLVEPSFVPIGDITDKEVFLLRMSGKVPDRYRGHKGL